jgi:hypothetical protein
MGGEYHLDTIRLGIQILLFHLQSPTPNPQFLISSLQSLISNLHYSVRPADPAHFALRQRGYGYRLARESRRRRGGGMAREPRLARNGPPGRRSDASLSSGHGGDSYRRPAAGRGLQSAIIDREAERLSLGAVSAIMGRTERLDLDGTGGSLERERGRRIIPHLHLAIPIADEEGRMPGMEECGAEMRAVDLRDGAGLTIVARDCAVAGFDFPAQDLTVVIHLAIETGFELHDDSSRTEGLERQF